jgi:acyl carrier protein phosphodiesterase
LLQSYREIAGIERALSGLSTRLSRPNPLAEGAIVLRSQYLELEADFRSFLPDLVRFARETAAAT